MSVSPSGDWSRVSFFWFPIHFQILCSISSTPVLCMASIKLWPCLILESYVEKTLHIRFTSQVYSRECSSNRLPSDRCTPDNKVCACLTLKRLPVLGSAYTVSVLCSLRTLITFPPIETHYDTAPDSWPQVSRDELNWWAVNRGSAWEVRRVRVPLLHRPCCPLSAAAP